MTEAERLEQIRKHLQDLEQQELRKAQSELAAYRRRYGKLPYLLWSGSLLVLMAALAGSCTPRPRRDLVDPYAHDFDCKIKWCQPERDAG